MAMGCWDRGLSFRVHNVEEALFLASFPEFPRLPNQLQEAHEEHPSPRLSLDEADQFWAR